MFCFKKNEKWWLQFPWIQGDVLELLIFCPTNCQKLYYIIFYIILYKLSYYKYSVYNHINAKKTMKIFTFELMEPEDVWHSCRKKWQIRFKDYWNIRNNNENNQPQLNRAKTVKMCWKKNCWRSAGVMFTTYWTQSSCESGSDYAIVPSD